MSLEAVDKRPDGIGTGIPAFDLMQYFDILQCSGRQTFIGIGIYLFNADAWRKSLASPAIGSFVFHFGAFFAKATGV